MLLKVEDSVQGLVDLSVAVWPDSCVLKMQQWVHPCAQKAGVVLGFNIVKHCGDCVLHCFLENLWRFEGFVWFEFHDVELEFFSESERWRFYEVDDASVEIFYEFVHYG
jgi:hypothetical protein